MKTPVSGALVLKDLTVRYPAAVENALERITLEVNGGELLAIAGPNGCGKTTLLRAASGVLAPLSGSAGSPGQPKPMHTLSPENRARLLAVVPQMVGLPSGFTVAEAVMLGRISFHGWFSPETAADREAVRAALAAVGLESLSGQSIETLSGGTAQRVLIARALAQGASILLMDEPTAHLDIRYQIETLTLLRRFAREHGHAVVAALHDLNLVARFADRVALLSAGRLVRCGSPKTVLTAEILTPLFQHPMRVIPHPLHKYPLVLPDGEEPAKSAGKLPQPRKKR
jgi:iron complex transport system ATP-binding protein